MRTIARFALGCAALLWVGTASAEDAPAAVVTPAAPAVAAAAGLPAPAPLDLGDAAKLDAALVSAKGPLPSAPATSLLAALGFDAKEIAALAGGELLASKRHTANLDADPALESVVDVEVQLAEDPEDFGQRPAHRHLLAWIDPRDGGAARVLGRESVDATGCIIDAVFTLSFQRVHTTGFDDTVLRAVNAPTCNGNFQGTSIARIWSAERGKLDLLLSADDAFASDRVSGKPITPTLTLELTGGPPRGARFVDDKKRTKRALRFVKSAFDYR
jgi:hypothetical protein